MSAKASTQRRGAGPLAVKILLGLFLFQVLTAFWVSYEIPRRLNLKVSGFFLPLVVWPGYYSPNARLEWKNKVTLLSGNLKIDYNLVPLLIRRSIRIKVSGKNISARLQGDWARMQGVENISIDNLVADIEVAPKGLGEIYKVIAQSPTFQFRIEKNET
jgi:hypothetical protein